MPRVSGPCATCFLCCSMFHVVCVTRIYCFCNISCFLFPNCNKNQITHRKVIINQKAFLMMGTKFVNNQSFLWQIFWSPTLSQIYSEFSYKKPSLSWLERMQWYCICPTFDYIQNTDKYRCICSNRDKHSFQCELQTLFWDSVQSRSFRRPVNFFKHSNLLDFKWRHGTPCTSLYLV